MDKRTMKTFAELTTSPVDKHEYAVLYKCRYTRYSIILEERDDDTVTYSVDDGEGGLGLETVRTGSKALEQVAVLINDRLDDQDN